ncbi:MULTISPECIES: NAD(P)H-dependent oxidoreductase [unclassified Pseudomonas]|uniref:NAD(P)H-dependent oxidoreductase n=1 Tax=unclassified Pseudomonas TaxID=196821 RepID=UPI000838A6E8|nr:MULTISPECIES: NAD(P)H-dependent oxidoreductase [unclassified Pseudomonas]QIH07597.1 NAD(P)H-dependent oxidoreductase [Pseudomonas sp. BIOMIG1BAC]UMZ09455.1 NAD(P)H-dependent oxidoreductase [Pseudomonas sp. MPFS]
MHALIVVAHHDPLSLSQQLAREVIAGIEDSGPEHSFELADLWAEAFDPCFAAADIAVHRGQAAPPADVLAEQARIDRADVLVLVYPVYWWAMPALLKGWIDRVFANGWAFDFQADAPLVKKLRHLRVHMVGVAGADAGTYERHGYLQAMKTQIDHGVFDYCGARVETSTLIFESESSQVQAHLLRARAIGRGVFGNCRLAEPV